MQLQLQEIEYMHDVCPIEVGLEEIREGVIYGEVRAMVVSGLSGAN